MNLMEIVAKCIIHFPASMQKEKNSALGQLKGSNGIQIYLFSI
jgi:hypothetical protein